MLHNSSQKRKGIILAGGVGTRLHPVTLATSKQLLPVYDKPMIYYPLTTLMLSNIRDVLVISTPQDIDRYEQLLGDGSQWGMNIKYDIQPKPDGIAQSILIGECFIGSSPVTLILGDNIFYGDNLASQLVAAGSSEKNATIFAYAVNDPERYGIIEFDENSAPIAIQEKPKNPKSRYAVTGLYFYDNSVVEIAKNITPSPRGELEITDINRIYLNQRRLNVELMGRGMAWLDTGTHESLLDAGHFVATLEKRQGLKIACPEEIAWRKGWINEDKIREYIFKYGKSSYTLYLQSLLSE